MSRHIPHQRTPSGILFSLSACQGNFLDDYNITAPEDEIYPTLFAGPQHPSPNKISNKGLYGHRNDRSQRREFHEESAFPKFPVFSAQGFGTTESLAEPIRNCTAGSDKPVDHGVYCLPILRVDIEVTVDGMLACSELTQTFRNSSDTTITESKHTFPLYDGATVTAFECKIGDESRLRGVVKPKEEAKQVYREAVEKRETAALLEEHTPEIFETSLAAIPPHTEVQIKLTYVHELKVVLMTHHASDAITVIVPTSIAPRYGGYGVQIPSPSSVTEELKITIRAYDDGVVNAKDWAMASGHEVDYEGLQPVKRTVLVTDPTNLFQDDPCSGMKQFVWKYESLGGPELKSDFILEIPMAQKHQAQPSAFISPPDAYGNAAMVINLRPTDMFGSAVRPTSFTGEIIFVLDYSGSMSMPDSKLDTMRAAVSLALSGLPDTCSFNVLKFGSSTWGLWDVSMPHSATLIETARAYTQEKNDLGGTELVRALKEAVKRRDPTKSSAQIIIITDGELNPIPTAEYVWSTRRDLGSKVRFFALGIGNNVSHQLIECVGELGGGLGDLVDLDKQPRWEDRLNRLLRAAMEPDSWNCEIDIGSRFERQNLGDVLWNNDWTSPPSPHLQCSVSYIQAPYPTPDLHPFSQKSIYFLIKTKQGLLPREITVKTKTQGAKARSYKLRVQISHASSSSTHHLAVKACLRASENEIQHESPSQHCARANSEYLGQVYSIPSKWTSFVAVLQESHNESCGAFFKNFLYQTTPAVTDREIPLSSRTEGERVSPDNKRAVMDFNVSHLDFRSRLHSLNQTVEYQFSSSDSARSQPTSCSLGISQDDSQTRDKSKSDFRDPKKRKGNRSFFNRYNSSPNSFTGASSSGSFPVSSQTSQPQQLKARHSATSHQWCEAQEVCVPSYTPMTAPPAKGETSLQGLSSSNSHEGLCLESRSDTPPSFDRLPQQGGTVDSPVACSPTTPGSNAQNNSIVWEDAVTDQMANGSFRLLDTVRERLMHHYCDGARAQVSEMVLKFPGAKNISQDILRDCQDTFMMIVYFRTHMAPKENIWCLMMSRAESALLATLCLSAEDEARLEPFYDLLQRSAMHRHFVGFAKSRSMHFPEDVKEEGVASEICPACRKAFGAFAGARRLFCPYQEADEASSSSLEWDDWFKYWEHQVEMGHVVCA